MFRRIAFMAALAVLVGLAPATAAASSQSVDPCAVT
jgi:hypothetical protein